MYLIATLILIFVVYCIVSNKRGNVNNFPSPPPHFFFGHLLDFANSKTRIDTGLHFVKNYGPTVKLKLGPFWSIIFSSDYRFTEHILTKTEGLQKSENYKHVGAWLGNGLLFAEGKEWKDMRKIVNPTFNVDILKNYIATFEKVGDVLIHKLSISGSFESLELSSIISSCTLDIISETVLGHKIDAQTKQLTYVKDVKEMCNIAMNRIFSLLKFRDWSYVLTRDYYRQQNIIKRLHKFTSDVITRKKENFDLTKDHLKKKSFMDLLLSYRDSAGNKLSDKKIREEVDTFMFAGSDTSAATISFVLYCLSKHPDIQMKILEEQKALFGDDKNPNIIYQDLQNMKYLENVIKETMRLYPPVALIGRFTTKNIEFEKHIIGKNTNIALFIFGMHRNPKYFPEPEVFDPDRFNSNDFASYAFMPFSVGHRNCIGQRFALLEIKSVVAKIVRNFEIKPAFPEAELELIIDIVLKSSNGIKVGLKQRL